jgi:hypothetical protein
MEIFTRSRSGKDCMAGAEQILYNYVDTMLHGPGASYGLYQQLRFCIRRPLLLNCIYICSMCRMSTRKKLISKRQSAQLQPLGSTMQSQLGIDDVDDCEKLAI